MNLNTKKLFQKATFASLYQLKHNNILILTDSVNLVFNLKTGEYQEKPVALQYIRAKTAPIIKTYP